MNKKHKIILIVIGILIITSITIGISYAYWQLTHKQTGNNELTAGCFEVTFEETGSDIVLTNTFPIIDEEGLQQVPYKFKIKNTCTIAAQYNITLNSFGTTNVMADSSIKYAFGLSNKNKSTYDKKILTTAQENIDTSNIDLNDLIKSYIIESGYLRVGEEKEFSLYLWMDELADNDQMSKIFSAKIYVTSVATNNLPMVYLMETPEDVIDEKGGVYAKFLGSSLKKDLIESITFVDSKTIPASAIASWDVSYDNSKEIMAWYTDTDSNGLYEVYVGQDGGVIANPNSAHLLSNLKAVTSLSLDNLDTSKVTNMSKFFYNSTIISNLNISSLNTANVIDMSYMFHNTYNLSSLDLSSFNTASVTDMSNMFHNTYNLSGLNLSSFNTANVTDMSYMFHNTLKLSSLNLSSFNTANVTDMSYMFSNTELSSFDLSSFNTAKVTNMRHMFSLTNITNIDSLSNWNTSNVTDMSSMFKVCTKLTNFNGALLWNTAKVTNMSWMFQKCTGLTSLDLKNFNTANVTNMSSMFANCNNLKNIDVSTWNTQKVIAMTEIFFKCSSLTVLDLSSFETPVLTGIFDSFIYDVYGENGAFFGCTGLTDLYIQNMTFDQINSVGRAFHSLGTNTVIYVKDSTQETKVASWNGNVNTIVNCSTSTCS